MIATSMVVYLSSPGPRPDYRVGTKIRFHVALQQTSCCAAAMQNMHNLSHCLFIKFERFRTAFGYQQGQPFEPKCGVRNRSYEPVTLAPPKRSFQRGMTSRL